MVHISLESCEETVLRLRRVIRAAEVVFYTMPYGFIEQSVAGPLSVHPEALAIVRDEEVWCQLIPVDEKAPESFALWRFHFAPDLDNSGFIGWLAGHLKETTGSGVFVICGNNTQRGGIYDYWACPWSLKSKIFGEIHRLIAQD